CWAGCEPRDVLAELRRFGLIGNSGSDALRMSPASDSKASGDSGDDPARRIAVAWLIWNAAQDARGAPVIAYLQARGITIMPPPSLRYAPALRRSDGTCGPAMIARVDDLEGRLVGIHRTWIGPDDNGIWRRRDRKALGRIGGGAVRFAPLAE